MQEQFPGLEQGIFEGTIMKGEVVGIAHITGHGAHPARVSAVVSKTGFSIDLRNGLCYYAGSPNLRPDPE